MEEIKNQYPNHDLTNEQKDAYSFGDSIGHMITSDWIDSGLYASRIREYNRNEDLMNNEIDKIAFMRKLNLTDEDKCLIDTFTPVPMCQKFIEVVCGGFATDLFRRLANGIDEISRNDKKH